jgi:high affinity choline transporter 7
MEIVTYGVMTVLFILMLLIGLLSKKFFVQNLAGEGNLSLVVGLCAMTASWVGGGYILGTTEMIYSSGLVWTQAPWGYALSLFIGGVFFAGRMRRKGYKTLLDPFVDRYGTKVTTLLYVPALLGEILWSAAVLASLGFTLSTLFDVSSYMLICVSAGLVVFYTLCGGVAVATYAAVLQLGMMVLGFGVALPFALQAAGGWETVVDRFFEASPASSLGLMAREDFAFGIWFDTALLLVFGGIPWGVYFQKILAMPNEKQARLASVASGTLCLLMAIPPAVIGMIGLGVDWGDLGLSSPAPTMIFSSVIENLTPEWVGGISLGVIAIAVMASVDSSIFAASSMFVRNIVKPLDVKERWNLTLVLKLAILTVGTFAAMLALKTESGYSLWVLSSDLIYVILFPQLFVVIFCHNSTARGALWGIGVAVLLRFACGEPTLGLTSIFPSEWLFYPYKTLVMLISLCTILGMSEAEAIEALPEESNTAVWQS